LRYVNFKYNKQFKTNCNQIHVVTTTDPVSGVQDGQILLMASQKTLKMPDIEKHIDNFNSMVAALESFMGKVTELKNIPSEDGTTYAFVGQKGKLKLIV